jgi:hypothetical protein
MIITWIKFRKTMKGVIPDPANNLRKYILERCIISSTSRGAGREVPVLFLTYPLHPRLGWLWGIAGVGSVLRVQNDWVLKHSVTCGMPIPIRMLDIYKEDLLSSVFRLMNH